VVVKGGGFRMVSMVSIWFQFVGFNLLVSIQWFHGDFSGFIVVERSGVNIIACFHFQISSQGAGVAVLIA
jgi:hypothetical protein